MPAHATARGIAHNMAALPIFLGLPAAGSQLLALWLLWRPGQRAGDRDLAVKTAALLPTISWVPFFVALAVPGTAVEDEPGHLPRVAGVPANLLPATLVPAISALGYALHRRGL